MSKTVKDLTAGTCGGIAQVLVGQPFDIVKVVCLHFFASSGLELIDRSSLARYMLFFCLVMGYAFNASLILRMRVVIANANSPNRYLQWHVTLRWRYSKE
jgi:hypothetical protein